jgi:hypothetical protein
VSWLWALLGLPFIPVVAKGVFDIATGRAAERRELRSEGAAIVVEIREFLRTFVDPTLFSTRESLLADVNAKSQRWRELRRPLLVYANKHPSPDVQQDGEYLASAVEFALAKRRALRPSRRPSSTSPLSQPNRPRRTLQRGAESRKKPELSFLTGFLYIDPKALKQAQDARSAAFSAGDRLLRHIRRVWFP